MLEHYLAWLPTRNKNGRIFVDGFAGPGEYDGGEEGSPVVAMRVLAEHSAKEMINAEVVFFFIEEEPRRARHLRDRVAHWRPRLPATKIEVREGRPREVLDGKDDMATEWFQLS